MDNSFVFLVLVLAAALVMLAVVMGAAKPGPRRRGGAKSARGPLRPPAQKLTPAQFADRWATIQAMAGAGGNGLRNAVAEADKLLDHALRQQGLPGDTMGDRLKAARSHFADRSVYDATWRAHKLRNALAHEVGFDLVPSQAREALSDFRQALRTLGAL